MTRKPSPATTPKSYPTRTSKITDSNTPTSTKKEESLQETIEYLKKKVANLEGTVSVLEGNVVSLHGTVSSLEKKVLFLEDENTILLSNYHVASCVNDTLRKGLDDLQQYQRRSCMIIDGIKVEEGEKISDLKEKVKTEVIKQTARNNQHSVAIEFDNEYDKCHRIGPIKDGKQSIIVKVKSHSYREKLYRNRTKGKNVQVRFKTSLTKRRSDLLAKASARIADLPDKLKQKIAFSYADIHGNLKIKMTEKTCDRWNFEFNSEQELTDILIKIDEFEINPYIDYED